MDDLISRIELKPCPFCGGKARAVVDRKTQQRHLIQCSKCKSATREFGEQEGGLRKAVEFWNFRTICGLLKISDSELKVEKLRSDRKPSETWQDIDEWRKGRGAE